MESERKERIKQKISEIKLQTDNKTKAKLELDKCVRITEKMETFSADCEDCDKYLNELEIYFEELPKRVKHLSKEDFATHHKKMQELTSHLQKTHHLIPENYYMSVYMSIGISIGLLFGLFLFDNIALGLPIGMILGIAIGTGLDRDAEKKGKTI